MQIEKRTDMANDHICLFFAGWSVAPAHFKQILPDPKESDYWICYDYRSIDGELEELKRYKNIDIVAWSLGVWVATFLLGGKGLPIRQALAINGTTAPINEHWGIPPVIFEGTLNQLSPEGLRRFNRRMCGNRAVLEQYETIPTRPIELLKEELQSLHDKILSLPQPLPNSDLWTTAMISLNDHIFPTANQQSFWSDRCTIREIESAHYPFHQINHWDILWKQ